MMSLAINIFCIQLKKFKKGYQTYINKVTQIGNYGLRLEFESWSPLEVSDETGGEGL